LAASRLPIGGDALRRLADLVAHHLPVPYDARPVAPSVHTSCAHGRAAPQVHHGPDASGYRTHPSHRFSMRLRQGDTPTVPRPVATRWDFRQAGAPLERGPGPRTAPNR
jgi:hypothetical protein